MFGNGTNSTTGTAIPVGVGDRFQGGTIAPRGIGILDPPYAFPSNGPIVIWPPPVPPPAPFPPIYNVGELASATRALVREFGLEYFEMPHKTHHNATMYGCKIPGSDSHPHHGPGGGGNSNSGKGYTVLLQAGIHARERGGPDNLLNFAADLLWARRENKGLNYGGQVFTPAQVRTALSVGIVILPVVNPDGVAYDQATNSCWRKNRNPASAFANDTYGSSIGVDINRNFPAAWDARRLLAPDVYGVAGPSNPYSETYGGTAPLSEPEAKNIDWVMDRMPDLKWFLDLHSVAGVLLYGWGHDSNQAVDKNMNLLNSQYDGKRGVFPDTPGFRYGEYYAQKAYDKVSIMVTSMVEAMSSVAGLTWNASPSISLYATTGTASSHPMYRSLADPKKKWAEGLALEFGGGGGSGCPHYPGVQQHQVNMGETGAAMMALLLSAERLK
ncbi:hypothetical protein B0T16DRAFT_333383 [Cercophora newfieldiana]|uniref:Peptidase M14 domain-containing protein n=1 Tax=Cercophora newfieldiana TaxID=92897 RepID=A0AA39Y272_9PEZI|nr:hypothetical protein B0T16DRAFT_333383 [Cercophora newfieldiana]